MLRKFLKKEPVFCAAALCAAASCLAVPPDRAYLEYLDLRTLALLYCLMVVVSGLTRSGAFSALAHFLCTSCSGGRRLGLLLILLCFFSSMLITNDVALISFVPFTAAVFSSCSDRRLLLRTVALETVAANMGSILTPVGNPQNLYLYSAFDMSPGQLLRCTAPLWLLSLAVLLPLSLLLPRARLSRPEGPPVNVDRRTLALSCGLFLLCTAAVLRFIPWYALLAALVLILLIFDRRLLTGADFMLLLTFVCFFVFSGNLGRMETVRSAAQAVLSGRELLTGALLSQVISNVPAAVLLSGFTENGQALLMGVDIGGLGTPVASLASLIGLRLYSRAEGSSPGRYMLFFSAVSFTLLALFILFGLGLLKFL